jgi:hypothetical protein
MSATHTRPLGLTFDDGTVVRGPSPRPRVIERPAVHILSADDPYADSQCTDGIANGDVLVVPGVGTAVMVGAWPVFAAGDADAMRGLGLHTLDEGADIANLGAYPWGRLFPPASYAPDGEYIAPRAGADYRASFARATEAASVIGDRFEVAIGHAEGGDRGPCREALVEARDLLRAKIAELRHEADSCPVCDGAGVLVEVEPVGDGTARHTYPCGPCGGTGARS